jgi:hypothetical protein
MGTLISRDQYKAQYIRAVTFGVLDVPAIRLVAKDKCQASLCWERFSAENIIAKAVFSVDVGGDFGLSEYGDVNARLLDGANRSNESGFTLISATVSNVVGSNDNAWWASR